MGGFSVWVAASPWYMYVVSLEPNCRQGAAAACRLPLLHAVGECLPALLGPRELIPWRVHACLHHPLPAVARLPLWRRYGGAGGYPRNLTTLADGSRPVAPDAEYAYQDSYPYILRHTEGPGGGGRYAGVQGAGGEFLFMFDGIGHTGAAGSTAWQYACPGAGDVLLGLRIQRATVADGDYQYGIRCVRCRAERGGVGGQRVAWQHLSALPNIFRLSNIALQGCELCMRDAGLPLGP